MGMRSASPPVGVEAIAAGVIAIAWSGTLLLLLPFNAIALGPFGFVTLSISESTAFIDSTSVCLTLYLIERSNQMCFT
jgi:hypothetical protein